NGFETRIGEAGRGLSSGEKQRVSIARAFLKKPHIVLLDEPTRGLDLATEKILQQSIQKLNETATVITVAHRLHTIKNADQILFLENGKL
ncbi:ATP-binding cassette domain-containing protein, partial [Salmonella enterica]